VRRVAENYLTSDFGLIISVRFRKESLKRFAEGLGEEVEQWDELWFLFHGGAGLPHFGTIRTCTKRPFDLSGPDGLQEDP
jgi:hypothetical protein